MKKEHCTLKKLILNCYYLRIHRKIALLLIQYQINSIFSPKISPSLFSLSGSTFCVSPVVLLAPLLAPLRITTLVDRLSENVLLSTLLYPADIVLLCRRRVGKRFKKYKLFGLPLPQLPFVGISKVRSCTGAYNTNGARSNNPAIFLCLLAHLNDFTKVIKNH